MIKKSQFIQLKQINQLPAIPIPPFSPKDSQQRNQRNLIDTKQSDFIKRLKKSKSIMIAQKNRKQKNVLNLYFMDNRKRRNNQSAYKSKSFGSMVTTPKKLQKSNSYEQKLQKLLFPPVHSSIQICFNNVKKLKNQQMRLQTLYEPLDIGTYLLERSLQKNFNKVTLALNGREQYQSLKQDLKEIKQIESQRQNIRQKINYTEVDQKQITLYKSQKRLNQFRFFKYNKKSTKFVKNHKNYTQQTKILNDCENFGGWEFRRDQEQQFVEKQYF